MGWDIGSERTPLHIVGVFLALVFVGLYFSNKERDRLGQVR